MTPEGVQHVAITGFSWSTVLIGLLNLLVGGALVAWIKQRPKMRELENSAEESLSSKLLARVQKLEDDKVLQDARIEVERVRHESQMAIMRHRVNNADACLDALLMLLKTSPEKVAEAVVHIERMRERQNQEVAMERGAQTGATLAVVSVPIKPA